MSRALWALAPTAGEEKAVLRGCAARPGVEVARIGVGPDRAARAVGSLLEQHDAEAAVLLGLAGGLDASLAVGTVVLVDEHGPWPETGLGEPRAVDGPLRAALAARLARAGVPFVTGRVLTSPRVISEPRDKVAWSDAIAVEMEGLAVATACAERGVPFASVRVVLDPVRQPLPDLTAAVDGTGRARGRLLVRHLARRPRAVLGMPALLVAAFRAHAVLERVAAALFEAPPSRPDPS